MPILMAQPEKRIRRFLNDISVFSLSFSIVYLSQRILLRKYFLHKFVAVITSTCSASAITYFIDWKKFK